MRTSRHNRARGWVLKGMLLLGLGVGAFFALDVADELLVARLRPPRPIPAEALPLVEQPGGDPLASDRRGNALLAEAMVRLEQRQSVVAQVVQVGWNDGRVVETQGDYRQAGSGPDRRFYSLAQGRLADRAARLVRVSDGRFLWTDLWWGENPQDASHSVTRVDLRRLRKELVTGRVEDDPEPGEASATLADASEWARLGGLPTVLASLEERFDFGPPRLMELRGRRVAAMVGRWDKAKRVALFGDAPLPSRAPHHAVVALDEETLFPLLVEYRAKDDPLSARGLPDEARLVGSRRPMLKIDYLNPRFDEPLEADAFAYSPPADVRWQDDTERELRLLRERRPVVAATPGGTAR
ncbi:MAG: hypothetical protein ACRCT8_01440 [Lacipirellulaceae bacterium]